VKSAIIADDHPIFRAGLKVTLADLFIGVDIREAGDMKRLNKILRQTPADLLLLDVFFPGLEPEAGIKELRRKFPLMAILIVSMLTGQAAIERLMRAGANGFVSKSSPPESIQKGLAAVMEGERIIYLSRQGRRRQVNTSGNLVEGLPPRQMQVLHLICLGLSNKEIARDLDLSLSTVRAHISALFQKLDVSNRAAAASYGALYGVLDLAERTEDS
jgi:DNA-binding NarL/FixJ family response regulator